ncbi:DUF5685 family protein [Streptomyces mangrovisoli]|uniref:Cysteine-rich transmembrane CYSTM domain-containing protein n=1 Tax=Streptomyces mangrovisoli TaxID=1428628 RepID=A0A1J4NSE7_9ACTN|nr:DUF5685 family protein [Streptomyces mangrovisoli]OIJ64165.1 hypothetical protein WN71_030385 [Streptomyces mangrovisoli]
MFGIVRPCRHRLGESLTTEWMAHLCGLCLALRGDHGQFARVVTNYDGLLISVLTEAQATRPTRRDGGSWRRTAGPCALRGMRTASVAQGEGARLAAAVSLVLASAKVRDHVADGDGLLARGPVALAARRVAGGWDRAGARTGRAVGFDTAVLVDAVDRQLGIEALAGPGTPVLTVTEPTETATAAAFAHTAVLAGRPGNAAPLAEAGRLFGRLAHLLDAVEDRAADAASGSWNPLTATGTPLTEARRLADDALHGIRLALREVEFGDRRLAHLLLAHELGRSVDRAFGTASCGHERLQDALGDDAPGIGGGSHPQSPQAAFGPPQGPYAPGPHTPGNPYGNPFGHPGGEPPRPGKRGFWAGCAAAVGLCCTCRLCCADEFEGPWSRKKRDGWCTTCGDCGGGGCDCSCCEACEICECCECCSCCDCGL